MEGALKFFSFSGYPGREASPRRCDRCEADDGLSPKGDGPGSLCTAAAPKDFHGRSADRQWRPDRRAFRSGFLPAPGRRGWAARRRRSSRQDRPLLPQSHTAPHPGAAPESTAGHCPGR